MTPDLDPLELDRRVRVALERLRVGGPALSLAVCRDLVALGFPPRVAWRLVEVVTSE